MKKATEFPQPPQSTRHEMSNTFRGSAAGLTLPGIITRPLLRFRSAHQSLEMATAVSFCASCFLDLSACLPFEHDTLQFASDSQSELRSPLCRTMQVACKLARCFHQRPAFRLIAIAIIRRRLV